MQDQVGRIAIIGAGNIGYSIARGVTTSGIAEGKIILTRREGFKEEEQAEFECLSDNKQAVSMADIIIVAVQPKQMDEVLSDIKSSLTPEHLLISVVSGASIRRIETLAGDVAIARAMPNIAIKVAESMTCLAFNNAGQKHKSVVEQIFDAVGTTLLIPENKFAEATVLCGSGTALAMKFLRGYMQAGIQHGFNERDALLIATCVLKGATMIVEGTHSHPESEIDKVTTPGGCTIAALIEMEHSGFSSALLKAIEAGIEKAQKLYT